MSSTSLVFFDSFCLDVEKKKLWRETEEVRLRPMALAVLRDLVEHAGLLVTKEDLLQRVWGQTCVTKGALQVCIREIRIALEDNFTASQYVATIGRKGYRFVAPIRWDDVRTGGCQGISGNSSESSPATPRAPSPLMEEKEAELNQLGRWMEKALQGERQIIYVTREHCRKCLEQYGEGGAYLLILDDLKEQELPRLLADKLRVEFSRQVDYKKPLRHMKSDRSAEKGR